MPTFRQDENAKPKLFQKGGPGGPGRAALPPDVREALRVDTLPRYESLKRLAREAEDAGDIKTAAHIELALLKKQIPDLSSVEVTGADGGPVEVARIDQTKLNAAELAQVKALIAKSRK